MPNPPSLCEARFLQAAPAGLYVELLSMLTEEYSDSFASCMGGDYRSGAGQILLPHYRRARVESRLEFLAHGLGLTPRIVRFEGNNDDFVLIEMPGGVELILCYVKDKDAPLRYAKKREELTNQSNMPYLEGLDFVPTNLVLPPPSLFAILVHSPDEKDLGRLGEANIIFPSPDRHYSLGSLSLHDEVERVNREQAAAAAQVQRKVEVKVKKGGKGS